MGATEYQLAQANIARMRGAADSSVMAEMVNHIDKMNALAEFCDGYAWR